jgi:transcriptional regulator with GAF, ATPase, and Fis domain
MTSESPTSTESRLRRERDLYRQLLELGTEGELRPLLRRALKLVVAITGAQNGYLEVRDESSEGRDDDSGEPLRWSMATGFKRDDIPEVRQAISSGVIAESIATGECVRTASAKDDSRFHDLVSVQEHQIEAVLCAPIGTDTALGAVYLQGRDGGAEFDERDQWHAEVFARHLVPYADRLIVQERRRAEVDATRSYREQFDLRGIVGSSPALADSLSRLVMVAPLPVDVLITGDTGTGKTLFARAIHRNSHVADGPFVELNCGTIPEGLAESELFGAVKGAHSTADREVPGKIAAADGGTLFLDEVGELPHAVQVKLLQFLQSKTYRALGSNDLVQAQCRVIAATNRDLAAMIKEGSFREDLYYRLHTLPIRIPPLAERRADVRDIVEHFVEKFGGAPPAGLGIGRFEVSSPAMHAATAAEWPGNVRELANRVKTAMLLAHTEGGRVIRSKHLFPQSPDAHDEEQGRLSFQEATRRFQRAYLLEVLEECNWSKTEAARVLDLSRSSIHNHIRAHDLKQVSLEDTRG